MKRQSNEVLLNEAHRKLKAFKKTGITGYRQQAIDRIRAAGVDIRKADEKNVDWLLDMLENTQRIYGRNPASVFKHAFRAGDRVMLTGKKHDDEGRTATVVMPARKTSGGIIDVKTGAFIPVNWQREVPVRVDGGTIDVWSKAWIRPVNKNSGRKKKYRVRKSFKKHSKRTKIVRRKKIYRGKR